MATHTHGSAHTPDPPKGAARGEKRSAKEAVEKVGPERPTSSKVMAAFRIPKALHTRLKAEAAAEGTDLTAYVNRVLEGWITFCGLPSVAAAMLEEDRMAFELGRYEYYQHILFRRYEAVSKSGPGADPAGKE